MCAQDKSSETAYLKVILVFNPGCFRLCTIYCSFQRTDLITRKDHLNERQQLKVSKYGTCIRISHQGRDHHENTSFY